MRTGRPKLSMEELKERAAAPKPSRRNQACYMMWRRARQTLGLSFKGKEKT